MTDGSHDSHGASRGIGFSGALTLLLIGLKLGHVLTWSWWWVLAPLWVPILLLAVVVGVALIALLWAGD